jgi:hypothetical protein
MSSAPNGSSFYPDRSANTDARGFLSTARDAAWRPADDHNPSIVKAKNSSRRHTPVPALAAKCFDTRPDRVDATRFLRSHSCLGSEVTHVEETIAFVASLPANDRIRVIQETYRSALIIAEGYNDELVKSEAEMLEELQQAVGEALPIVGLCPSHDQKGSCSARGMIKNQLQCTQTRPAQFSATPLENRVHASGLR